jgi:hypothetical protein
MEHKGVRYEIRIGIAREQWLVAIYLPDKKLPKERTVVGTRRDAEIEASSIIDAWLRKRRAASRRRGPSRNTTTPASSFGTTTGSS